MANLKQKANTKGKWYKTFKPDLGGGAKLYKNFAQKLLAVSLCMAVVLLGAPLGGQGVHVAAAADPVTAISVKMFAEPDDLVDAGNFSLDTADTTKVGKINFGTRPGEVKYYKHNWSTVHSVGTAGTPTPITWLIAGSDVTNGLVLYSEAPLVGANAAVYEFDSDQGSYPPTAGGTDSRFQVDTNNRTYNAPADSGYGDAATTPTVFANHWGASNVRAQLTGLVSNSSYFKSAERGLMTTSKVSTIDARNHNADGSHVTYSTEDVLYAPRLTDSDYRVRYNTSVTVGGAASLTIDCAHWGGSSWVRSPHPRHADDALSAHTGSFVSNHGVHDDTQSISAAFRLDLSSVLFTSAASAASSAEGGPFEKISADTPMTLRLDGSGQNLGTATLSLDKSEVLLAGADGSTLLVQGVTAAGHNWSYSKAVSSADAHSVSAAEVAAAGGVELTSFDNCKVWLERPVEDGRSLSYAVLADESLPSSEYLETTVTVHGRQQRVRVYGSNSVLPEGTHLKADAVVDHEHLDDDHDIEHLLAYDLSLLDASGNPLQMPLNTPVELCFEVLDRLDQNELKVVLVKQFDDGEFAESLVERDGASWISVKTNHFSPYALIDKLSDADKASSTFQTYVALASIGVVLILVLGIMLRLHATKKKFEK